MKLIGRISDPRLAQAFADYMAVKGVQCKVAPHQDGYGILTAEEHVEQVQQEFVEFAKQPLHRKYRSASWNRTDKSGVHFDYGSGAGSLLHQIWVQAGPLTLGVLAVCLVLFILSLLGLGGQLFMTLHFPSSAQWLQAWRFWTPAFMHFEPVHLLFNLVWWWYLGGRIEREMGSGTLGLLLIFSALLSNSLQNYMVGPNFLGLSGVVYALLGYIAVMQKSRPALALPPMYIGFMLLWLVLGFANILGISMANYAHLGGLLVGVIQGLLDHRSAQRR